MEAEILSGANAVIMALRDDQLHLPSYTCAAAGLPAPIITWIYIPNLDREHEKLLSDGEKYQIANNVSEKDDGRQITASSLTFLELTATDGGVVRCKASSPPIATAVASADALLTVIGTQLLSLKLVSCIII